MADIKVYLNKFSEGGGRVFARALEEARRREQNCVVTEHLIAALVEIEAGSFDAVLANMQVERAAFQAVLEQRLAAGPRYTGRGVRLAPETIEVCKLALRRAESYRRRKIEPVDLLVALALHGPANLFSLLGPLGVTPATIVKTVLDFETAVEVARVLAPTGAQLIGRAVRIKSGPFASFTGFIANVNQPKEKLEVGVAIFGHRKFIELSPDDIEFLDFKK
ncbi:MAG TPA: Clp protease N-terminal domain-containing protein [Pyrinomonadaceae bacterium]|jgi:ATP-dependent Clp protease ATP-binding subunit ClpA